MEKYQQASKDIALREVSLLSVSSNHSVKAPDCGEKAAVERGVLQCPLSAPQLPSPTVPFPGKREHKEKAPKQQNLKSGGCSPICPFMYVG